MNYATIKNCDIANGPGVRISLFVSGCTHHCPGCFNQVAWDFAYGEPFTGETEDRILDMLRPAYIRGLTLLGGEPFEPQNQAAVVQLLRRIRRELPKKTIWAYSGFTLEEMLRPGAHPCCEATRPLLALLDVLVDGRFVEELRDISLRFRGSRNQRIIDLRKTREQGQIVLWQEPKREI